MEIVKTKKGENLNKTKTLKIHYKLNHRVQWWWDGLPLLQLQKGSLLWRKRWLSVSFLLTFRFQLYLVSNTIMVLLCLMQFFEDGKKISNRQCLTFSCQIGHNVMLSLSLGFHPAFKNVHTDPLSERNTSFKSIFGKRLEVNFFWISPCFEKCPHPPPV